MVYIYLSGYIPVCFPDGCEFVFYTLPNAEFHRRMPNFPILSAERTSFNSFLIQLYVITRVD